MLFALEKFFVEFVAVHVRQFEIETGRGTSALDEIQARVSEAGVSLVRADYAGPDIPDDENLHKEPVFAEKVFLKKEPCLDSWCHLPVVMKGRTISPMNPATGKIVNYAGFFGGGLCEDEARLKLNETTRSYELRLEELRKVIGEKPVHPLFAGAVARADFESQESHDYVAGMIKIMGCFRSSGLMALRSGNSPKALETIKTMDRISDPSSIGYSMFIIVGHSGLKLVWEGVRLRAWTEDEMAELSGIIAKRDFKRPLLVSLNYQAAFGVEAFDSATPFDEPLGTDPSVKDWAKHWFRNRGPAGWSHQQKALLVKSHLKAIEVIENDDRDALKN